MIKKIVCDVNVRGDWPWVVTCEAEIEYVPGQQGIFGRAPEDCQKYIPHEYVLCDIISAVIIGEFSSINIIESKLMDEVEEKIYKIVKNW